MVELKASNSFILLILPSLCIVKGDGSSLNCTFDDDFCLWKQDDSDDFDWAQHRVESYIYIKTSHQFPKEDKNARIISTKQRQSPFCLKFLYNMYGMYIGNLNVYMRTDDEDDNLIFIKEKDMRNLGWQKAVIGKNSNADFQIIIEGYISAGIYGDIAIDDISMTYKFCSVDCNFNSGLCNWMQGNNDVLNWRLSRDGNYIYIEKHRAYIKEYASLISPLMEEGKYCFSFWYHMYGKHTGTLIVKKAEQQKTTNELCVISGSEEARWIKKTIFIQSGTYFKVIIEGTFKDGFPLDGYIAVDDVDVTSCQDCENPLKSNGRTNSSTFQYGSVIEVTCNSGYHLIGPSTLICRSGGIWSAPATCEPDDCENPQPNNGNTNSSNFRYGSTVEIMCQSGYDLIGPSILICQLGGIWSANVTCDPIDCENPQPNNGNTNSSNFRYGSTVEIMCHSGYHLIGPSILICQLGGIWSANVTCDPIDCENPQPSNGSINSSNFRYGSTVEIMCHSGYHLIGPSILICQFEGIWSANVTCDPIECKDPTPKNKMLNSSNFRDGSAVEIICNDGYTIRGKSVIYCQENGNWTAYPSCMLIDCLMPKIANGIMSGSRNYTTYNQTVDIVCEGGYDLVGNKSITCQADGYWSALPTCDLRESMNSSDFTFFVYVTLPLVAVALAISVTAIVCRKKVQRYFASRRQPGNLKKENVYENESHQHVGLSKGDENVVIADERHEIGQGEIIEFSTIADAATTTVIEIQQYNNTKTNRVQVVDNFMKQTKGATKDCNHGYEQSEGETSTSEYYSLGPQSVDEKHYSVLMRDEEEIKADDGATKNEYEQIVEYYTLGQQSVDEKHYSVLKRDDNDKKANDGATDIEYEQPVGATPEYFVL